MSYRITDRQWRLNETLPDHLPPYRPAIRLIDENEERARFISLLRRRDYTGECHYYSPFKILSVDRVDWKNLERNP